MVCVFVCEVVVMQILHFPCKEREPKRKYSVFNKVIFVFNKITDMT